MLKIESWRDLVGTNIQNVTELEFENDHYKYISTLEGMDIATNKYVVEKTFQCREERKQLYLYVENDVVYHFGDGYDIEEEMLSPEPEAV